MSAGLASAGPLVIWIDVPSSFGSTVANVVLPRPGGPSKRMCPSGSLSFFEAFTGERRGHSIQVRIYAEDANKNFQPSCGVLTEVSFHASARCETWVEDGTEVTPFYDPMLAKIIVHGSDRADAMTFWSHRSF